MKISHECAYCQAIYTVKTGTTKQHHKDIKCPFCEHEEVLLINGDGGDYGEKKLNNYKTINSMIVNNRKKIDNQKNEITRLQNALNMANGTVAGLMDDVANYKRIVKHKNEKFFSEINNIEKRYESQLKVHENELDRRLTIIHYLEDRLFNKGE